MIPQQTTYSHRIRTFTTLAVAALAVIPALPAQTAAPTIETLHKNFLNPPNEARPMVRWWWFGPAVVKPEILTELQQMKADGIQGAELAFVYPEVLDDPAKGLKNFSFLSPEMLDAVNYAQSEGRKLGLRIDVTLCSGWPYGGPHITLEEAVGALHIIEVQVPANATSAAIPTTGGARPSWSQGDSVISAVIADPAVATAPPTPPGRGGRGGGPRPPAFNAATAKPISVNGTTATFAAADKPRVAVFFVASHTRQQVKRAAVDADGFVLDPFSHEAVAKHLEKVGEPLLKAFGATPPYAIFSDSLEAYGSDWTPKLPEEFKKRRGYDLIPHLPELVAGGTPAADNIRHDYGVTLTELINENYLTQINDWAKAHNTKFRSQTYGEPAVSFSSQNLVGLAEGEGPQWRAFSTLRWATSANHVFNHNVTSGETFTWLHSPVFRATPLDMKAEADIDFIMGENQIICHGWPYSPPDNEVPEPGWSLYAAASFNNHNPWHPVMPSVTAYIGRLSYLMRQGASANQVVILLPTDDAWSEFRPTQTTITGAMQRHITPALMSAILSAGYNVDFIDAEAINKVGLGAHQIVVLPPTDRIPVETLRKIAAFQKAGGKAIAIGRAPSMDPEGKTVSEISTLSKQLFDSGKSTLVTDETSLPEALAKAVKPDFQLTSEADPAKSQLGFIRRKLANADIYFVTNTSNGPIDTTASFATAHKTGEAWDTDSGKSIPVSAASESIHLAPYESRVFVFSDSPTTAKPVKTVVPPGGTLDISTAWKVTFAGLHKTVDEPVVKDWTSDPSTLHYSGEAIYSRDVQLTGNMPNMSTYLEIRGGKPLPGAPNSPPEHAVLGPDGLPNPLVTRPGPGMHAYFDPPIHEAALVTINGQPAGALWHPPYRLNVTGLIKTGMNHIEIHVYNTALNAWSALPPHDYGPLIAKYGDRFQMQDLNQVKPIPSGLLGEVLFVAEVPSK